MGRTHQASGASGHTTTGWQQWWRLTEGARELGLTLRCLQCLSVPRKAGKAGKAGSKRQNATQLAAKKKNPGL